MIMIQSDNDNVVDCDEDDDYADEIWDLSSSPGPLSPLPRLGRATASSAHPSSPPYGTGHL